MKINIFPFWPHQARAYMHQACHLMSRGLLFSGRFFYQNHLSQQVFHTIRMLLPHLTPSKIHLKPVVFNIFTFGPTEPIHICIILAISCLEAHFSSFCSFFDRFFYQKPPFSISLLHSWNVRAPFDPFKNTFKTNGFSTVSLLAPPSPYIYASYLPSHV